MPRQARQESATGYYHVMMRGINREFIFRDDGAKKHIMKLLTEQQTDGAYVLVAWCVMDNHLHLLLKSDIGALSKAVKVICLRYAAYYNGSYDRIGPVFGDRYKSENIEDDAYLLGALRYIHLNPVKAKLVPSADAYVWSSYNEYLDAPHLVGNDQRELVLGIIGGGPEGFQLFHQQPDENEYLEIAEQKALEKEARALALIEAFCCRHGVTKAGELQQHRALFAALGKELIEDVGLSLRKTASYLGTTHHLVHKAMRVELT